MRTIKPVIIVGQCIAFLDRIGRTSDGPRIKPRDIHYPPSPGLGLTNQDRITRKGPFVIYWISWPRVRSCCCSCCIIIRSRCHSQMVVRGIGKSQRGPRSNENSALPIQRRRWLQASSGLVWLAETLSKLFSLLFAQNNLERRHENDVLVGKAKDSWIFLFPARTASEFVWDDVSPTIRIYKNNPQSIRARGPSSISVSSPFVGHEYNESFVMYK